MSKKKKSKRIKTQVNQRVIEEQQSKRSNSLVWGGVVLAMCSIGLLVFVLSEKVFHLS
tara:strand:- start:233 stop:406 length:174 start_codon:yes stop_codon:yes gene_type:complete